MGKLDGKIALITGASEGMGFVTAQRFLDEDVEHVYITGRRKELLDEAVKKLNSDRVTGIQADSSILSDLDKVYQIIKEEKGRLDVLFASAGTTKLSPLDLITEDHFHYIFDLNVKGVLFTVQKALSIFSDGGSIILNGSVLSVKGIANRSVYCASKAALRSFARCWTVDLKDRGIRVNVLSPGPIDTPMLQRSIARDSFISELVNFIPMHRVGQPEEIASAVVFLACSDSSYVTGIDLHVDGGMVQI